MFLPSIEGLRCFVRDAGGLSANKFSNDNPQSLQATE